MNYMKQVAEMLGLEWDDEKQESEIFKIKDEAFELKMNYFGVIEPKDNNYFRNVVFIDILSGEAEIIKKPWKPKYGEKYFMPNIAGFEILFDYDIWDDFQKDNYRYENNLIYRTKEEAIAEAERILQLRKEADK